MRVPKLGRIGALAAAAVLLGACTGGSAASPSAGGAAASDGAANGGGGGGDAGSLNACNLLTTDQIAATVGWAVDAGLLQNSDGQTDCEWAAQASDSASVGLTIANYDDTLWQAGSSAGNSTAVPGIGDAAFKGWPHAGDLSIKYKGYEVDVAIIDFVASPDQVDMETLALAKLVLPSL